MTAEVAPVDRNLSLSALRRANVRRLPLFRNAKGEIAHLQADGSDWKLSAWSNAVLGELGELANMVKKIERGDFTLEEQRVDVGKEIADVLIYLDILAFRCGVDLGAAVIDKFNEVSHRVSAPVFLSFDGSEVL
jgi:NTP pyrophosphatase (non-canonical NTP hydrolase)